MCKHRCDIVRGNYLTICLRWCSPKSHTPTALPSLLPSPSPPSQAQLHGPDFRPDIAMPHLGTQFGNSCGGQLTGVCVNHQGGSHMPGTRRQECPPQECQQAQVNQGAWRTGGKGRGWGGDTGGRLLCSIVAPSGRVPARQSCREGAVGEGGLYAGLAALLRHICGGCTGGGRPRVHRRVPPAPLLPLLRHCCHSCLSLSLCPGRDNLQRPNCHYQP